ncbi:hypothetical protein Naga_100060g1 [Nannochloropsis gaditana]|uniref:Uncharacterized protein n=1 Tax=Nannochloropsis gaditana TaxID=72520 RepID=W7TF20_9STRA|nr:hypothetical protein Naga_100060g1 [Nannochloropsis gaditana]
MADPLDSSLRKRGGESAGHGGSPSKWARQGNEDAGFTTEVVEVAVGAENENCAKSHGEAPSAQTFPAPQPWSDARSTESNRSNESLQTIGMVPDEGESSTWQDVAQEHGEQTGTVDRPIQAETSGRQSNLSVSMGRSVSAMSTSNVLEEQAGVGGDVPIAPSPVTTPAMEPPRSPSPRQTEAQVSDERKSQQTHFNSPQAPRTDGVDHWILMQRLRGLDPSLLLLSLLDEAGLTLSMPLSVMSQETQWTLIRRLVLRDALSYRKKLQHVNTLDDVCGVRDPGL